MMSIFARIFCLRKPKQSDPEDEDEMGPVTQSTYKCPNCKHVSFSPGPHRLHVTTCSPGSQLSISSSNYRVSRSLAKSKNSAATVNTRLSRKETKRLFEDIRMVGKGHGATATSPGYWTSLEDEEIDDIIKIVRTLRTQPIDLRCQGEIQFLYRYAKERSLRTFLIAKQWIDDYFGYLKGREHRIPGPINNSVIDEAERKGHMALQYQQKGLAVNELIWQFFVNMYGGGPEIKVTGRELSQLFIHEVEITKKTPRTENFSTATSHEDTDFGSRSGTFTGKLSLMSTKKLTIDFLNGFSTGFYKVKGITNGKFYCYMNCALQMLLGIPELTKIIETGEYQEKLKTSKSRYWGAFADAVLLANSCNTSPISLTSSTRDSAGTPTFTPIALRKLATSKFRSSEQHDVHEFLYFILSGMQDEMNLPKPKVDIVFKNPDTAWEYHLQYNLSIIDTMFSGQYQSRVTCKNCQKASVTFEPFLELTVPVVPEETKTLYDCFNEFGMKEDIKSSYKCDNCKAKNNASKQLSLRKLPNILIVHLNRFRAQPKKIKINGRIDFPINNLRIPMDEGKLSDPYKLIGVISHTGVVDSGHYTAYSKRENEWYYCDDEKVKKVSEEQIEKDHAYILFYERYEIVEEDEEEEE